MKISEALSGYWLDKKLDFSQHTVSGYLVIFERLVEFLHDPAFASVTTNDLRRFLVHLANEYELGSKSLSNAWIALSSLWSWAERELSAVHIIRGKIKRPRFTGRVVEPLDRNEIKQLLEATKQKYSRQATVNRNRAILLVLLDTGIRASELCDLTVADYDKKRARLHIRHGKGDKERFVYLGNRTQKSLWRYLTNRRRAKPAEPLFASQGGNHLDRNNLRHLLDTIGKNAGVNNVHPHRFRHTYAIEFLRAGGNVLTLQVILGHETLEMVKRYAAVAERDIDEGRKNSPADNWRI